MENILDEQILIAQLGNGITFEDTNNMDVYERRYVIMKLLDMEKDKVEARDKAIQEAKNKR